MKDSANRVWLLVTLALVTFGVGVLVGIRHLSRDAPTRKTSFQQEMDAYCAGKMNEEHLSKLSLDEKKGKTDQSFYSRKLHTCVQVEVTSDRKNAGTMNYIVSDFTYGFVAPPKWHHIESPLHVIQSNYGNFHHLYVSGYWGAVTSDPGQQSIPDSNAVELTCDYTDGKRVGDGSNICTETDGYTEFGSIQTDTQTYHIASWRPDEVIATDAERGLSGATTTTLLIHPGANEVEVVDRTKMDEKQPALTKGMEGKSFGDHYELHGGGYLLNTQRTFFQCDEDGVVIDMRLDTVQKHHGDVVNVPQSEWNAGSKANHKYTQQECDEAMQKKLKELE